MPAWNPANVPTRYTDPLALDRGKALRQDTSLKQKQEEVLALEIEAYKNPQPDTEEQRKAARFMQDSVVEAGAAAILYGRDESSTTEGRTKVFQDTLSGLVGSEAATEFQ